MTEDDYISRLRAGWPHGCDASLEVITLADDAVRAFPQSARLWVMRGDLIQLGPESCPHPLEESLRSYQRAVDVDPKFAEAWDEIGHYFDAVLDDENAARPYFDPARSLKRTANQALQATAATRRSRTIYEKSNIIIAGHARFRRLCLS
jgi:hypothetical protein